MSGVIEITLRWKCDCEGAENVSNTLLMRRVMSEVQAVEVLRSLWLDFLTDIAEHEAEAKEKAR